MKFDIIQRIFKKESNNKEIRALLFQTSTDIERPEFLFGREEKLSILHDYAEGLHQVEIIGARRFGKTCLAKSFVTYEKGYKKRNVYPILVDIYSDEINGTANVYRYLSAHIIANLYNDGYISDGTLKIDDYIITPHANWKKISKQLRIIEDRDARGCFDEIVEITSKKTGQIVLLIFDEYEKSTEAFDNVHGFRHLRKLSNDSGYFKFWIVGATPWEKFVKSDGKTEYGASHVFNGIQHELYVCPLDYVDFQKMWNYECNLIQDETIRQSLESQCEKVFISSGGVPCFAKEIGAHIYIEGNYPEYDSQSKHFAEIVKNLSDEEIGYLKEMLFAPKEYESLMLPKSIKELEKYGLVVKDEQNKYNISIRFFADYLHAKLLDEQQVSTDGSTINSIVDKIEDTIYQINNNWNTLYGKHMFDPAINDQRLFRSLRKECDCREKAPNFVNSIYILYWEGSKENGIVKIPEEFKWTMFRKAMDCLRHTIGGAHQEDKLKQNPGQIKKDIALKEIYGSQLEPQSKKEWLFFQQCMLNRFCNELIYLNKYVEKQIQNSNQKQVLGIFHKGIGGKKDSVEQNDLGYYQQVHSIRQGEVLNEGDEVEYFLCWKPNPQDPTRKFWYAEDVHLKE